MGNHLGCFELWHHQSRFALHRDHGHGEALEQRGVVAREVHQVHTHREKKGVDAGRAHLGTGAADPRGVIELGHHVWAASSESRA